MTRFKRIPDMGGKIGRPTAVPKIDAFNKFCEWFDQERCDRDIAMQCTTYLISIVK